MTDEKKSDLKLSFFLNMMGVASTKWYEENNIPFIEVMTTSDLFPRTLIKQYTTHYYCGRIDVHGHPQFPFNYEYGVDIMDDVSWGRFGNWLDDLYLNYLPDTVEEIYDMFESETGYKIKWWEKND